MVKGAICVLLVLWVTGSSLAQESSDTRSMQGERRLRLSQTDGEVLTDARIAMVKRALQLTPDQEKHWPAVEDAIRAQPKTRYQGAPFAERGDVDPIERLRERANATAQRATALKKLADAWQPLYQSVDPDQKMQMRVLRDLIMRDAEDASLQGAAMKFVSAVIQPFKLVV